MAWTITYPKGRPAALRALTLTTCNPRYSAAQRLIVHALLVGTQAKSLGPPPELPR